MGVDVFRLGEPALPHPHPDLHLRSLFRLRGRRRPRPGPSRVGLRDLHRLDRHRADGPGAGRRGGRERAAQAMDPHLLRPLHHWSRGALGRGAGTGRSHADPGLPRHRPDRGRVHGRLHQLSFAGAWNQGRNRPHLRLRLGDGILGRAREPRHRARPDGTDAGVGKKRLSASIRSSASTPRTARAPAPPARCRRSGTSSS